MIGDIELKLISILRSRKNYEKYQPVLNPTMFQHSVTKELYAIIQHYFSHYKGNKLTIRNFKILTNTKTKDNTIKEECFNKLKIIRRLNIKDEEVIYDIVVSFSEKQQVKQLLLEIAPLLDDKRIDIEAIRTRIEDIAVIKEKVGENSDKYLDYLHSTERDRQINDKYIPTSLGSLDTYISGGLGRGELGIVLAPPGRGKTLTLINLGANALLLGHRVLHFTLEISDRKVARRYDARISGVAMGDKKPKDMDLERPLARLRRTKGGLIIKEHLDISPTVTELKKFITRYSSSNNINMDLVIVDYADLMTSTRKYKDKRFEFTEIYASLRRMSKEFNCAVWTASQSTRKSMLKRRISLADFAEDIQKAAIADLVLTLCQTEEEENERMVRLFLAKNRRGSGKPTLKFNMFPDRMYLGEVKWKGL